MAAGDGGIFRGLGFILAGFEYDPQKEELYRNLIQKAGGIIKKMYIRSNLYLIAYSATMRYSDGMCSEALKKGAVLVNEMWLEDSLSSGVLADVTKILYRPPKSLGGIKGASDLKIALSGFGSEELSYLKKLIEMMGAETGDVANSSYLICNTPEGDDYETAEEKNIFRLNKHWLEACLTEWDLVSIDNFISRPSRPMRECPRNYRTPLKDRCENCGALSTGKRRSSKEEASRGSPEGSRKRYAFSTGRPKPSTSARHSQESSSTSSCKLRLDFNRKRLSEYKARELVLTVQIPRSRTEKTVGTDAIKGALLQSFTALVNIHRRGECVRNDISAERTQVSLYSDEATFDKAQLVPYDPVLAKENKRRFVLMVEDMFKDKGCTMPEDISCWLKSIDSGVPDKVLTRHVNMMTGDDAFGTFVKMFYIIKRMIGKKETKKYHLVVDSKLLDRYKNWQKDPFTWSVFNDTLTYVNPKLLQLYNLKKRAGESIPIPQPKSRDGSVFGLLEVMRDCFFHPGMDYQDLILPILLVQHPELLSDLQAVLFSLGFLK